MKKNDSFQVLPEIEVDEVNNSGLGSEKEERQDIQNKNLVPLKALL